jgi:4a-hydroxytetrahydrobiopterin dehydratase
MALLTESEIRDRLASLNGWDRTGNEIKKTYTFESFADSIAFVNRVSALAETADHHPDFLIQYTRVTLSLSTHSAGGLTRRDMDLAGRIDELD